MIRLTAVQLPDEAAGLVAAVVRSGRLAQGDMVRRLEEGFAELTRLPHAVAVNSGTAALEAALAAAGIGPGDEVVTSPFTFVATLNAILAAGATVRFADVGLDDALMRPDTLEAAISPRTQAVMPVHLYGQLADMGEIAAIAARHSLLVIEDAAQAVGADQESRAAGSWGVGCFSLYATKNLTTGEGGVVTTEDGDIADRLRLIRNQGMRTRYEYEIVGRNFRMTELQAALGVAQLPYLATQNRRRQANAARLRAELAGVPGLVPLTDHGRGNHTYHQFTVRVTGDARMGRDEFVKAMTGLGVETGVYYPRAAYDYEPYRIHPRVVDAATPIAERLAREVVSLPVNAYLLASEIDQIVSATRSVLGG